MNVVRCVTHCGVGLVAALALIAGGANTAEAAVKGNAYTGVLFVDGVQSGTTSISFFTDNTIFYEESFTGFPTESFGGTYTEINLGAISFFSLTGEDESQNGIFDGQGLSILGIITLIKYQNPDFAVDWAGVYFRTGGARSGSKSPTGGSGGPSN